VTSNEKMRSTATTCTEIESATATKSMKMMQRLQGQRLYRSFKERSNTQGKKGDISSIIIYNKKDYSFEVQVYTKGLIIIVK
jgi:hypothetical protein